MHGIEAQVGGSPHIITRYNYNAFGGGRKMTSSASAVDGRAPASNAACQSECCYFLPLNSDESRQGLELRQKIPKLSLLLSYFNLFDAKPS